MGSTCCKPRLRLPSRIEFDFPIIAAADIPLVISDVCYMFLICSTSFEPGACFNSLHRLTNSGQGHESMLAIS